MVTYTERLLLRELEQGDFPDLAALLQDPQVMTAYEHTFTDGDVQEWMDRQRRRYREDGFGLWAVLLRKSGQMIGLTGLTLQPYDKKQVLEIGYLLKKEFWNCGYAREAAQACKEIAFGTLGRQKVYSIIKADNKASMRVAESIGMKKEAEFTARYYAGDRLHFLYSVGKAEKGSPA